MSSSSLGAADGELRTIRWAVLGTGSIATDMVQILKQLPATEVLAVGSRTQASADRFADRWAIPRRYSSYEEACKDGDVDVVYVATPSLRHPDDCKLALSNGKAVLCEKSMAPNVEAAREVLDFAKSRNLLFVHGVWSRFFPIMQEIRKIIESGEIGEVRSARASFCQNDGAGSCSALLETGIYCAQFLQWVLSVPGDDSGGHPTVRGACRRNHSEATHLDEHVSALLDFGNKMGTFECSLSHCSERSAAVYGTGGVIEVPFPFWCPTKLKVTKMSGQASQNWEEAVVEEIPLPEGVAPLQQADGKKPGFHFVNSEGLLYEAGEMNRCVREGLAETPAFSSAQCLDVMRIISEIDIISKANSEYRNASAP
mmetsp:Transcript_11173/g.24186  ORF Transcript_11173/g.24186 Transcript_11173/m.24186 type:complete len:370 (+) Transcript_11173:245-1354(+)|eukprot:CAMPEP_0178601552 /NCGR_PEP_ID=MMETSP0697-20121206/34457_1 /TAXON_ID=265572 /ORGANISM="Extubocellulus spinifer, Strain CCMP396" /LENGTH=369 /DNA_ID=CAMNT_0020239635 /DNA_START=69 /DNA_END=1178 /DNA_ORIENTATION=+